MTTTTGVFLPDDSEQQPRKKSPRSVKASSLASAGTEPAKADYSELAKLGEHELKAAIKAEWKKHEESAKQDLAPLLYFLREQLRAQGARNDLSEVEKDRGFGAWVEEHVDISRRTADRWCEWFAAESGLKADTTSRHVSKSDVELWVRIQNKHEGHQQIAFNYWVSKTVHGQFTKALATLQKRFNLKNKKEAMVRGVIYAAAASNGRTKSKVSLVSRAKKESRNKSVAHGPNGHRGGSGLKAAQAAAGR